MGGRWGAALSKRAENKGTEKKETQRRVCGDHPEQGHSQSERCDEKPGEGERSQPPGPGSRDRETMRTRDICSRKAPAHRESLVSFPR